MNRVFWYVCRNDKLTVKKYWKKANHGNWEFSVIMPCSIAISLKVHIPVAPLRGGFLWKCYPRDFKIIIFIFCWLLSSENPKSRCHTFYENGIPRRHRFRFIQTFLILFNKSETIAPGDIRNTNRLAVEVMEKKIRFVFSDF